jgi:hypothetical protein
VGNSGEERRQAEGGGYIVKLVMKTMKLHSVSSAYFVSYAMCPMRVCIWQICVIRRMGMAVYFKGTRCQSITFLLQLA